MKSQESTRNYLTDFLFNCRKSTEEITKSVIAPIFTSIAEQCFETARIPLTEDPPKITSKINHNAGQHHPREDRSSLSPCLCSGSQNRFWFLLIVFASPEVGPQVTGSFESDGFSSRVHRKIGFRSGLCSSALRMGSLSLSLKSPSLSQVSLSLSLSSLNSSMSLSWSPLCHDLSLLFLSISRSLTLLLGLSASLG